MTQSQSLARWAVAALCAGAALFLVLEMGDSHPYDERAYETFGTAIVLLLAGLAGGAGMSLVKRRPQLALFGIMTAIVSLLAFLAVVTSLWSQGLGLQENAQVAASFATAALAMAFASLLLGSASEGDSGPVRIVRGAGVAADAVLTLLIIIEILTPGETIGTRPLGMISVLFVLGAVLQPLARRAWP